VKAEAVDSTTPSPSTCARLIGMLITRIESQRHFIDVSLFYSLVADLERAVQGSSDRKRLSDEEKFHDAIQRQAAIEQQLSDIHLGCKDICMSVPS
jgi:hypothetical protein